VGGSFLGEPGEPLPVSNTAPDRFARGLGSSEDCCFIEANCRANSSGFAGSAKLNTLTCESILLKFGTVGAVVSGGGEVGLA